MTTWRVLVLLLLALHLFAGDPVYVVLWFDTEDYIEPAAGDAAPHIANDLTALGVQAAVKVVGANARTLESRGRTHVTLTLSGLATGFHAHLQNLLSPPA